MPTWIAVLGVTVILLCGVGLVQVERSRRRVAMLRARLEADARERRARERGEP